MIIQHNKMYVTRNGEIIGPMVATKEFGHEWVWTVRDKPDFLRNGEYVGVAWRYNGTYHHKYLEHKFDLVEEFEEKSLRAEDFL